MAQQVPLEVFSRRVNGLVKLIPILPAPEFRAEVATPEEDARIKYHNDAIKAGNVLARYHGTNYDSAKAIDSSGILKPTLGLDPEWQGVYTGVLETTTGYLGYGKNLGKIYAVYQPAALPLEHVADMSSATAATKAKELLATKKPYSLEGPQEALQPTLVERVINLINTNPPGHGYVTTFTASLYKVKLMPDGVTQTAEDNALEDTLTKSYSNKVYP